MGGRGGHQKDYTLITDYTGVVGVELPYIEWEKAYYDKSTWHNLYLYVTKIKWY